MRSGIRRVMITLIAATTLGIAGCSSGPSQLSRSVDDWDNQLYVQSPWMDSILHLVPVIPVMKLAGGTVDLLFINPWYFWTDDAWDSKGTGFKRAQLEFTDGYLGSLMVDDQHQPVGDKRN